MTKLCNAYFSYQQSNGYKPQPLDAHEIILGEEMKPLIDALAKNTHNVWAKEKIRRGWTFGLNEVCNVVLVNVKNCAAFPRFDFRD